ncbi:hypothetical protein C8F01DRAFT_1376766 [Mycena amicta]|nr:hypothetical protein C8F01DRAFT_1376766 [Mycena amicta]
MPVSFPVATHPAQRRRIRFHAGGTGYTPREILAYSCEDQSSKADAILQSSFDSWTTQRQALIRFREASGLGNGFFTTVIDVYRQDHALVIRPDDVWLAVLSQFNFFVNSRAEVLRANFVAHSNGERADWLDILRRLEKLKEYGLECIAWYHLLRPVISRFVAAFDAPADPQNVAFWDRVAHCEAAGSGAEYISRWITAFCAFDKEGNWLGHRLDANAHNDVPAEMLSPEASWTTYAPSTYNGLVLDGTPYHRVTPRRRSSSTIMAKPLTA